MSLYRWRRYSEKKIYSLFGFMGGCWFSTVLKGTSEGVLVLHPSPDHLWLEAWSLLSPAPYILIITPYTDIQTFGISEMSPLATFYPYPLEVMENSKLHITHIIIAFQMQDLTKHYLISQEWPQALWIMNYILRLLLTPLLSCVCFFFAYIVWKETGCVRKVQSHPRESYNTVFTF